MNKWELDEFKEMDVDQKLVELVGILNNIETQAVAMPLVSALFLGLVLGVMVCIWSSVNFAQGKETKRSIEGLPKSMREMQKLYKYMLEEARELGVVERFHKEVHYVEREMKNATKATGDHSQSGEGDVHIFKKERGRSNGVV